MPTNRSPQLSIFISLISLKPHTVFLSSKSQVSSTPPASHHTANQVYRHVALLEQNQACLKNLFSLGIVNLLLMAMIWMHKF